MRPINYLQNFDNNPINTLQRNLAGNLRNQANAFNLQQAKQGAEQQAQYDLLKQQALETGDISLLKPQDQQAFMQVQDMKQQLVDKDAGRTAFGILRALQDGDPDAAKSIIANNADDINALGDPMFTVDSASQLVDADPEQLARMSQGIMQLTGFNAGGAKPLTENQKLQADLRQQEIDLGKEKLDFNKLQKQKENEIKRLERQVKASKDQVDIDVKNQKLDKAKKEAEQLQKQKVSEANSAISQAEDTIQLINRITSSEGFESSVGAKGASSLFGLLDEPIAGTDAADTAKLIETLESKNFLNAIQQMKGLGALSNAEGQKVSSAIQNLGRNQSEKQLKENLNKVIEITQRGIDKARKDLGANSVKNNDTVIFSSEKYKDVTEADIQETMKANGLTREQVLSRLKGG